MSGARPARGFDCESNPAASLAGNCKYSSDNVCTTEYMSDASTDDETDWGFNADPVVAAETVGGYELAG